MRVVSVAATVVVTTAAGAGAVAGVGEGAAVATAVGSEGAVLPWAAAVWPLSEQLVTKKKSTEMPKINVLDICDPGKK